MNIFYLDANLYECAKAHVDSHVIKGILEYAQLLSTAQIRNGIEGKYRATHLNHPSNVWARASLDNYQWLGKLAKELCKEYTYRYGKIHKTESIIDYCISNPPKIPSIGFTTFPLCMPDPYKLDCPILSYRQYYNKDKVHLFSWKNREIPHWIQRNE